METIIMVISLLIICWFWMIADCIAYETEDKTIWMSILLVANIAGAFAYLALRYRSNRKGMIAQQQVEHGMQS
jgi:uncharacterized membrane-anchored protein